MILLRGNPIWKKTTERRMIHYNSPIYRNYRCILVFLWARCNER